jgi:2-phospho-L-lactate guanylyltransferase
LTYARTAYPASCHLVLFADLPLIGPADVQLLVNGETQVAIASDRRGTGTNALLLRGAETAAFTFQFGESSHRKHLEEARRLRLPVDDLAIENLGFDLDTVEDWFDLPVPVRLDLARRIGANGDRAGVGSKQLIPGDMQERYTH